MDSLNGACEFAKQDTSPFSTKKHMYGKGEMSDQATQHVSDEVMKRTVSVKCYVQFNAAFVTWSNRFKLSMWFHRFATNRFISYFASPLFAFYFCLIQTSEVINEAAFVWKTKFKTELLIFSCFDLWVCWFLPSDGDAWQQRGHGWLPGESLGKLPNPGPASPTPRQPLHSRPEVLWSSVQQVQQSTLTFLRVAPTLCFGVLF